VGRRNENICQIPGDLKITPGKFHIVHSTQKLSKPSLVSTSCEEMATIPPESPVAQATKKIKKTSAQKPEEKKSEVKYIHMFAVTFVEQFDEDYPQHGLFPGECTWSINVKTMEEAEEVKADTLAKYQDEFYRQLVEEKDNLKYKQKVKKDPDSWGKTQRYTFRYSSIKPFDSCPTFASEEEAGDFIKMLNMIKGGQEDPDREWIRKVCQSYLELKMRITPSLIKM